MYFYAARQPILDKNKNLYGYELLFKDGVDAVLPDVCNDDGATDESATKIIEASKLNSGIGDFTGNKPALITFTLDTLQKGYPEMLAPEELIVQVLEKEKPGKTLLALCKQLYEKKYTLVLDQYQHQKVWFHFYPFIKHIKVNFAETSLAEIKEIVAATSNYEHITLIAHKVENHQQFDKAVELGFDYFQGYFFSQPEVVKSKNLTPSQMAMAELLYESSKPELDLASITGVFERDVTLSYKLLRYANSAMFRRRNEISTIKQALVTLGSVELKRFIGLMFAVTANPDKPSELIVMSMARAKFCEIIGEYMHGKFDHSTSFLTGLMSMIDAIVDQELSVVLEQLPLAKEIKDTLLNHEGPMAKLLDLVAAIEKADWDASTELIEQTGLDKDRVIECYHQSVAWADEQSHLAA